MTTQQQREALRERFEKKHPNNYPESVVYDPDVNGYIAMPHNRQYARERNKMWHGYQSGAEDRQADIDEHNAGVTRRFTSADGERMQAEIDELKRKLEEKCVVELPKVTSGSCGDYRMLYEDEVIAAIIASGATVKAGA